LLEAISEDRGKTLDGRILGLIPFDKGFSFWGGKEENIVDVGTIKKRSGVKGAFMKEESEVKSIYILSNRGR